MPIRIQVHPGAVPRLELGDEFLLRPDRPVAHHAPDELIDLRHRLLVVLLEKVSQHRAEQPGAARAHGRVVGRRGGSERERVGAHLWRVKALERPRRSGGRGAAWLPLHPREEVDQSGRRQILQAGHDFHERRSLTGSQVERGDGATAAAAECQRSCGRRVDRLPLPPLQLLCEHLGEGLGGHFLHPRGKVDHGRCGWPRWRWRELQLHGLNLGRELRFRCL
mmetsp:Transcript_33986/g.80155  ORF Transcript_33986/g.80155 Transcript_33986/m.80155 type:complete len:222 (+) Transcript_33986:156-821(+)|eukprot:scaffold27703_cov75-Phaeocystis_antarctica.AAC.6